MSVRLALDGGSPVRRTLLPYGHQWVDDSDVAAVIEVLRSSWLTTGPKVAQFEKAFCDFVGTREAVAVSSGTAALHSAMYAAAVGPGDEVIVPSITFIATANSVVFQGGTPVFGDVDADTLLIDPSKVEEKITPQTRALIAVDYAGQPCDYDALRFICAQHRLVLVADACHSIGGKYREYRVGSLADLSAFSFHPVKHITTGEGGVVTTDNSDLARRIKLFRNHGISTDHYQREAQGSWIYEMVDLGYNYRLTDIQCGLGMSQLSKLPDWVARRQEIACQYTAAIQNMATIEPLGVRPDVSHSYHLYVVRLRLDQLRTDRATIYRALRAEGIGVNVHYIPVHLQPFYRRRFGLGPGLCPVAERAYDQILSLPIFPRMSDADVEDVATALHKVLEAYSD